MTLELYGDSILKGIIYDATEGKYRLYHPEAQQKLTDAGHTVINRSHMGATVGKGVALLERCKDRASADSGAALPGRCAPAFSGILLMDYGSNDCDFDWKVIAADPDNEHLPRTPEAEFCAQYKRAVALARARGKQVVLTTLVPIDPERYFKWISRDGGGDAILHWLGDVNILYRFQEHYSHLTEKIARECGCPLIDTRETFLSRHDFNDLFCEDGIHLNPVGQELYNEQLASALIEEAARLAEENAKEKVG